MEENKGRDPEDLWGGLDRRRSCRELQGIDVGMLVMAVVASIVSGRVEARLPAKRERVAGGPRVFGEGKYVWKAVRVEFCQLNRWRDRGQSSWWLQESL